MADEKILEEEVLDEGQLGNVAGGVFKQSYDEAQGDVRTLNALGKYDGTKFDKDKMEKTLQNIGKELGVDISCRYDRYFRGLNLFSIDLKMLSHDEFWAIVKEGLAANKK